MGGEVKTNLSDDFKALETEMNVKHEGERDSPCFSWHRNLPCCFC
jgi:hypothetical protein